MSSTFFRRKIVLAVVALIALYTNNNVFAQKTTNQPERVRGRQEEYVAAVDQWSIYQRHLLIHHGGSSGSGGHGSHSGYRGCLNKTTDELQNEWRFNGKAPDCSFVAHHRHEYSTDDGSNGENNDSGNWNNGSGSDNGNNDSSSGNDDSASGSNNAASGNNNNNDSASSNNDSAGGNYDSGAGNNDGQNYDGNGGQGDYVEGDDRNGDANNGGGNGEGGEDGENGGNDGGDGNGGDGNGGDGNGGDGSYVNVEGDYDYDYYEDDEVVYNLGDESVDPFDYFNVSECDTYENLWLWDLSLTCDSAEDLDSCECTFANDLMDEGSLTCNDVKACPDSCDVCVTCLQLMGCDYPGKISINSPRSSHSSTYVIAGAIGLFIMGLLCYFSSRYRKKDPLPLDNNLHTPSPLNAHLIDDDATHNCSIPPHIDLENVNISTFRPPSSPESDDDALSTLTPREEVRLQFTSSEDEEGATVENQSSSEEEGAAAEDQFSDDESTRIADFSSEDEVIAKWHKTSQENDTINDGAEDMEESENDAHIDKPYDEYSGTEDNVWLLPVAPLVTEQDNADDDDDSDGNDDDHLPSTNISPPMISPPTMAPDNTDDDQKVWLSPASPPGKFKQGDNAADVSTVDLSEHSAQHPSGPWLAPVDR